MSTCPDDYQFIDRYPAEEWDDIASFICSIMHSPGKAGRVMDVGDIVQWCKPVLEKPGTYLACPMILVREGEFDRKEVSKVFHLHAALPDLRVITLKRTLPFLLSLVQRKA